jgi:hypothetical protein
VTLSVPVGDSFLDGFKDGFLILKLIPKPAFAGSRILVLHWFIIHYIPKQIMFFVLSAMINKKGRYESIN